MCEKCGVDIFDINSDLRAKLETAEESIMSKNLLIKTYVEIRKNDELDKKEIIVERDSLSARIGQLETKLKFSDANYKKAILIAKKKKVERDQLFPKVKQLESQVAKLLTMLKESIRHDYITPELKDLYDELKGDE